ncbi:MAG: alpha/beta fold hydrolase [Geodermatophilaceae bacterium]
MPSTRAVPRFAAVGLAAGAARWVWRHQRSAAVAVWTPGSGEQVRAGPLSLRSLGSAEPVVLLLHGMIAAGNSFGAVYDALTEVATLVVPDLLGFGGSMATTRPTDAAAHLQALDDALSALGLDLRPTIVAGHSMGGALALRWAAAHTDQVRAVVAFGAPLYRGRAEADEHVAAMGGMETLLATDGWLPRTVCAWMCRHRTAASWIAVAHRPDLPVAVARSGVKHTWATYGGSMDGLIRDTGWQAALDTLRRAGIPVSLVAGAIDPVPVAGLAAELATTHANVTAIVHPSADHGLPLTDPAWCRELITDAVDGGLASGG